MSNNTEVQTIFNGWFSQNSKDHAIKKNKMLMGGELRPISYIYLNTDGKEVEVTEVSTSKNISLSGWKDHVYKGKFVKWIRSVYH